MHFIRCIHRFGLYWLIRIRIFESLWYFHRHLFMVLSPKYVYLHCPLENWYYSYYFTTFINIWHLLYYLNFKIVYQNSMASKTFLTFTVHIQTGLLKNNRMGKSPTLFWFQWMFVCKYIQKSTIPGRLTRREIKFVQKLPCSKGQN